MSREERKMYKFRGFAEEETYHVKSLLRSVGERRVRRQSDQEPE